MLRNPRAYPRLVCDPPDLLSAPCMVDGLVTETEIGFYLFLFSPKSSRLAHLYGLPKTHKATLSMRPILSATGT